MPQVKIEKTGAKTFSITLPHGARAKISKSVDLDELLAVISAPADSKDVLVASKPDPI